MKKNIYRSLGIVLMLSLCLGGCGDKGTDTPSAEESKSSIVSSAAAEPSETAQEPVSSVAEPSSSVAEEVQPAQPTVPDIVLDPEEIEWGYQEPGSSDQQYWYNNGDKTLTQFIFFDGDYMTLVNGDQRESFSVKIVNRHMVDWDTEGQQFDFVFTDVFTCYDYVSGLWYMRSDYDTVAKSLTASRFVCEAGSQWSIQFMADGTLEYDFDGELLTGTWWFQDARTVEYHLDKDEEGYNAWFTIAYEDGSWNIASLKDTDVFYPEQ